MKSIPLHKIIRKMPNTVLKVFAFCGFSCKNRPKRTDKAKQTLSRWRNASFFNFFVSTKEDRFGSTPPPVRLPKAMKDKSAECCRPTRVA